MGEWKERRQGQRRNGERRRLLDEEELRRVIETGQAWESDRRSWVERRRQDRRANGQG